MNRRLGMDTQASTMETRLFPVVETQYGKVRGLNHQGVKTFLGIKYGASTGEKNRFMPPQPVKPWAGVTDALDYGQISPQTPADRRMDYTNLISWHRQPGGIGEDCLTLNVWSRSVNDNAKRAVTVVLHGGGFTTGSGNHQDFDGEASARLDDIVHVSINHRLGAFGYLNLADLGASEEFKYAGVAGIMDLVAALKWIQTNVDRFGGDPNRVFVYGQSGGGGKTSTLLATPSAKGLFQRAGIQSGSTLRLMEREQGAKNADAIIRALGIDKKQITDLQKLPFSTIMAAQASLSPEFSRFSPVIGNEILPHHPYYPAAPPESADIPVIISTTLDDAAINLANFDMTEAELKQYIDKQFEGNAKRIYKIYRDAYPDASPYLIQARLITDRGFRYSAIKQTELKVAQNHAPVYYYLWEWAAKAYDGKFGAVHGVDVAPAVHDYRGPNNDCGQKEGKLLVDRFAAVWTNFAKTGVPNSDLSPEWPRYDLKNRATMVFNNYTRIENDYRREFRQLWEELGGAGIGG
jgi:para-nitrobenzyl esterase